MFAILLRFCTYRYISMGCNVKSSFEGQSQVRSFRIFQVLWCQHNLRYQLISFAYFLLPVGTMSWEFNFPKVGYTDKKKTDLCFFCLPECWNLLNIYRSWSSSHRILLLSCQCMFNYHYLEPVWQMPSQKVVLELWRVPFPDCHSKFLKQR